MNRFLARSMLVSFLFAGGAPAYADDDTAGFLSVTTANEMTAHTVNINSMFFSLQPPQAVTPAGSPALPPSAKQSGDDAAAPHTFTMTARIQAPDPVLIAWLTHPEVIHAVTLRINDRDSSKDVSVYKLGNAHLTGLAIGYSSGGGGQQTLSIEAEHLEINGQPVY
ncbi:MAG: hypothetical protein ACRYF2_19130 [Janthinobacterium lividum]